MLKGLSIRNWLVLMGGTAVGFLVIVGGLSIFNARQLDRAVSEANVVGRAVRRQMEADMMHDSIRADVLAALLAGTAGDASQAPGMKQVLKDHISRLETSLKENTGDNVSDAVRKQAARIAPTVARYTRSATEIVSTAFTNLPVARAQMGEFEMDFTALETDMEALSELIQKQSTETEAKADATLEANLYEMVGTLLLALVILTPLSVHLMRLIGRPLAELAEAAHTIERTGDLTLRVRTGGDNEIGQTIAAFNSLLDALQGIVRDVREGSVKILDNSRTVATAATQTARAAEQSSEAASSMAAAMEQLSVSIDHISAHAQAAAAASQTSGQLSRTGEAVVGRAAAEMSQIADSVRLSSDSIQALGASAEQISNILNVIKEIADQTNLLALNAAIEAARAGEQGRGFAVVADEVRKLAERTTQSTGEISSMINTIQNGTRHAVQAMNTGVQRVESGVDLANQAGTTIQQVAGSAADAEAAVNEMSLGLREQSAAGQEIARNVEQVSQMSGQSHAAARESSQRAGELAALAQLLDDSVKRFKT